MNYNFLGSTGLRVSSFGLGTMTFGGSGSHFFEGIGGVGQREATWMTHLALDLGVNLIDTADVYSRGIAERMLGKAIKRRRDDVLIATKCHGRMSNDVNDVGQSRHHIFRSCEGSLRRLGVDHIDIYQIHNVDAYTAWEECLGALTDLVQRGTIRYIGCSNLSAWQLMKALSVSEQRSLARFVSYQGNYSLVAREAEYELLPLCLDQATGFIVWSPLAGGFLTGKYSNGRGGGRRQAVGDPGTIDEARGQKIITVLQEIARQRGASASQVALNWLRTKPGVSSVLVGARDVSQLRENLDAATWSLRSDEQQALDDVSQTPLIYPYWHHQQYNLDRYTIQSAS
jgi:aryl-alcohol dehydrogenase-like predicted oxidoreductase